MDSAEGVSGCRQPEAESLRLCRAANPRKAKDTSKDRQIPIAGSRCGRIRITGIDVQY